MSFPNIVESFLHSKSQPNQLQLNPSRRPVAPVAPVAAVSDRRVRVAFKTVPDGQRPPPTIRNSVDFFQRVNLTLIRPIIHSGNETFANRIFSNILPFLGIGFARTQNVVKKTFLPMWCWKIHFSKSLGKWILQTLHPFREKPKATVIDRRYSTPIGTNSFLHDC